MRLGLRWVRVRSDVYIYYREWRYGGFRWANRRMFGHRFGRFA